MNKIRTDIAMIGTKLNAQVIIKNLHWQNMHAKSLPPTGARGEGEWTRSCKAVGHTRADPKTA